MHHTDLYRKALEFACKAHNNQKMPSTSASETELPYFLHITEVMTEIVVAFQNTKDENINTTLGVLVAILHDTVEDTAISLSDIETEFGKEVRNGVWAMTKNEELPKERQMEDSLAKLLKEPKEVQAVKLADRIVNLKEPPHYWSVEKKRNYQQEARLILEKLQHSNSYLAKRLSKKIVAYEQFLA